MGQVASTGFTPELPYVSRIEVINATPHKILVANAHAELPEDRDWRNTRIADATGPTNATIWAFDRYSKFERALAWSSPDKRWTFDIEIRQLGPEYFGKTVEVMMADVDSYASRYKSSTSAFVTSNAVTITQDTAVF
jgi:hypothetical protein